MQIYPLTLNFKDSRNYIQGPDLVNALLERFAKRRLTHLNFTVHRMVNNVIGQLYLTECLQASKTIASPHASAQLTVDDQSYWAVFLFQENKPTAPARQNYDETQVTRLCEIQENGIQLSAPYPFSFVETIVSMYKNLLKTIYPNAGKWLFTKLILKEPIPYEGTLRIVHQHNFNFKLVKADIWVDGQFLGELYFSLIRNADL